MSKLNDGISASAKPRKNAAYSASRGLPAENTQAPKGRKVHLIAALVLVLATMTAAQSPNEQLPPGPAKDKAEAACLTCHEARIMVQQRLTKAAWVKEVDKMTKWGAEVDPKDRDALIDYLSVNFGPDQAAYAAPRSAADSKPKTKR